MKSSFQSCPFTLLSWIYILKAFLNPKIRWLNMQLWFFPCCFAALLCFSVELFLIPLKCALILLSFLSVCWESHSQSQAATSLLILRSVLCGVSSIIRNLIAVNTYNLNGGPCDFRFKLAFEITVLISP